eukprot:COSAG01_NODE_3892_length_5578_cov_5.863296_8_plen_223_part_00
MAHTAADTNGTGPTAILKTAGAGTALTADATLALFQPSVAAVDAAPQVTVDELFLDVMMAVPSTPMPPIPSMQIPYQGIEVYTRTLAAGSSNFTESFSSIPASLSALVVGLRTSTHGINLLAHDKHNPSAPWPAEKALSLYSLHSPSAAPEGSAFRVVYTRPGRPGTSVNIARLGRALHERNTGPTGTGAERFWRDAIVVSEGHLSLVVLRRDPWALLGGQA